MPGRELVDYAVGMALAGSFRCSSLWVGWRCTAVLATLGGSGCECSNMDYVVDARVVDQNDQPVEGVEATTCPVESEQCTTVTSDAGGNMQLEIDLYRPRAFACDVREVVLQREGCERTVVHPTHPAPEGGHRFVIPCGP